MVEARRQPPRSAVIKGALIYALLSAFLVQVWVLDSVWLINGCFSLEGVLYYFVLALVTSAHGFALALVIYLAMRKFSDRFWPQCMLIPAALVLLEFIQFLLWINILPWSTLPIGYVLGPISPLIQFASIGGVWIISYLVYASNLFCAELFVQPGKKLIFSSVGFFALSFGIGFTMMSQNERQEFTELRIELLIDGVDHEPWSDENGNQRAQTIIEQAEAKSELAPLDLILWSETAIPWTFQTDDDLVRYALQASMEARTHHLIGTKYEEPATGKLYNAALLIASDGAIVDVYKKTKPLPLLESELFGMLASDRNDLSLSSSETVAPISLHDMKIGVGICNEWMSSDFGKTLHRKGAQLFVNLSNNNYFRLPMMKVQHLNYCLFRCVENRLPMVVNNNLGYSGWINEAGIFRAHSAY